MCGGRGAADGGDGTILSGPSPWIPAEVVAMASTGARQALRMFLGGVASFTWNVGPLTDSEIKARAVESGVRAARLLCLCACLSGPVSVFVSLCLFRYVCLFGIACCLCVCVSVCVCVWLCVSVCVCVS